MVKKMKRRVLTDVFIKSWFSTFDKLKIVCKRNFRFDGDDNNDFNTGYAYIMRRDHDRSDEFYVTDSNKDKHWVYEFDTKNKFFHKYFEIARLPKQ